MTSRNRYAVAVLAALAFFASSIPGRAAEPSQEIAMQSKELWVYIGTYTWQRSKGIYFAKLDLGTGQMTQPELVATATNPTFLTIAPSGRFLYSINEIDNFKGKKSGGVSAYTIDPATGKLTLINQQPSGGPGACFVSVDPAGKNVLVADYAGGCAAVLPVGEDGQLAEPSSVVQHQGKGPNAERQEAPHAHSINLTPDAKFALVADLGLDKVFIYRFDAAKGALSPNDPPFAQLAPGAGPRHLVFHPNARWMYVIDEIANTVTVFDYDASRGAMTELQVITTLPEDFTGKSTAAEVQVHPSGRFLYGTNRGHNSIAMFGIDQATGKLTAIGHEPTQGKNPRNFRMDPSGTFLLTANQDSNNIVIFRINAQTGKLQSTGNIASVPLPVCVKFLAPPK